MAITSDGTPSPERIKDALEMLSDAVCLIATDVRTKPQQPNLDKARELASEAKKLIQTGIVSRS